MKPAGDPGSKEEVELRKSNWLASQDVVKPVSKVPAGALFYFNSIEKHRTAPSPQTRLSAGALFYLLSPLSFTPLFNKNNNIYKPQKNPIYN